MLRRLFRNRPSASGKGSQTGAEPAAVTQSPANPEPASPSDALLALPENQAAAAIRECDDVDTLIELALAARSELRREVLAHPKLALATSLTALEKGSRHRNKSVNRHARRLLDRRRSLQHEAAAAEQRASELRRALEKSDSGQDRPWRERQHELYRRLEEALTAHAAARAALAGFGDSVPDLAELRVDPASLPPLEPPEPETGTGDSNGPQPATAAPASFAPLVEAFLALDTDMREGVPFEDLAERRQTLTERWLTAADHAPPEPAQHDVFETVSHRFRELADANDRLNAAAVPIPLEPPASPTDQPAGTESRNALAAQRTQLRDLDRVLLEVGWPDWAPPAPRLQALRDAATALRGQLDTADRHQREELAALESELEALARAIDEGSLGPAQSLLARIRSRHDAIPPETGGDLSREIGKQAARLAELKDWQTFATTPKREALLEAMAALAESPLAAPDQADRIKELRRQWRDLGPVTQAADGRLADRFNAQAEKAFETCRSYFAEQAERRKANLAARQALCDQLQRYLDNTDWRRADMKAAEQIMRAAREEWRRYHPVDRGPGKAVEARFEGLQGMLHDRVKAEWDRNLTAKEALVAEAEALADGELSAAEKVEAAIALQRRWREIGVTPRRPDQRLWRAFRAACDRVFAERDDVRHAAETAIQELELQLRGELDAFQTRLDDLTANRASAGVEDTELREFRRRTAALEQLPAARRRGLEERRRTLEQAYRRLLDQQARRLAQQRLETARRWDLAAAEAEADGSAAPEPEDPQAVPEDVIAARRATLRGAPPVTDLHRLAIRAELAAGLPSPDEDQALRLEVQVSRLQAGLSGSADADTDAEALLHSWCRLGPKNADVVPLRDRFFAALSALQQA